MKGILFITLLLSIFLGNGFCSTVEEFQASGPMDFHSLAMNNFLELRKKDPSINLNHDGEFLKRANEHAIRRMRRRPEIELSLRQLASPEAESDDNNALLNLPAPSGSDNFLVDAVNKQGTTSNQVILPQEARAQAMIFNEDVGLGAISKAGALPMGTSGEWLEFAEKKLKNDESLDYQALLWELGSELAEIKQIEQGGLNITHERKLLKNMEEWFYQNGGKLQFATPNVDPERGFELLAQEDVNEFDPVITAPLKLIMCRQTARNVVIPNRGRYLGEELNKAFEKNELWGMVIFLLHEYYKEIAGNGSKWGPFIRTLRMRFLTTPVIQALKGTIASQLNNKWLKASDDFMWWSVGADGPCSPTTGICKSKPNDKTGDSRFNIHQIRWAYWVVKQNAVRIRQISTGLDFIALIPFYNMLEKNIAVAGGVTFDLDGTVSVRAGLNRIEGQPLAINPGNLSDSEFFLRYLRTPKVPNPHTEIKLKLPGVIPKGSKFHYCLKGTQKEQNRDDCKASFRSDSMFWKSKVLTEWRQIMNLPPRLQELRMWATRLHLYGGQEEMALLSQANSVIAGLPIPVDQMPAEEQLMLMGIAKDNLEAALIASGPQGDRPPPQLYTAPDPTEDPEAERSMQNLATLALQAEKVYYTGNLALNATQVVLNKTRDFFTHGVLPMAGLDELDMFLLKKIGMLAHCGFENDMKITNNNITEELMCAMRVHLMNESEIHVFCPKEARVWEDNCLDVQFMNYTAISYSNEMDVINALKGSIHSLMDSYPSSYEEDKTLFEQYSSFDIEEDNDIDSNKSSDKDNFGPIMLSAIELRLREKEILMSSLNYLNSYEQRVIGGNVTFQLEIKARERIEADQRAEEHKKFLEEVKRRASIKPVLANVEVDLGESLPKVNLTLNEGDDIKRTLMTFFKKYDIPNSYHKVLEDSLRKRITHPPRLQLILGVVTNIGERKILGIPEGSNHTIETGTFCAKYDNSPDVTSTTWCQELMKRVENRLFPQNFQRNPLLIVPVDAPDGRKLQLVIREGDQHDLGQYLSDFFEYYHIPFDSLNMMYQEVNKRLPGIALQIPVQLSAQRQVIIRFSLNENITNVVEAFVNFFQLDEGVKIAILKRARYGMAPGTFMV